MIPNIFVKLTDTLILPGLKFAKLFSVYQLQYKYKHTAGKLIMKLNISSPQSLVSYSGKEKNEIPNTCETKCIGLMYCKKFTDIFKVA